MQPLAFIVGAVLIALWFWDVFPTIVAPRPTPGRYRVAQCGGTRADARPRASRTRDE